MTNPGKDSARQRLIDAAGKLFANKGFSDASVREICDLAGTNQASINYYFRNKEKLYHEVLNNIIENIREKFPPKDTLTDLGPEELVHAVVHTFLMLRFDPDRPEWHGLFLSREILNPHSAFHSFLLEERYRNQTILNRAVEKIIGPYADSEKVRLYTSSIIGQCLVYVIQHSPHSPVPVEERDVMDREMIDKVAKHITAFSIAGIKGDIDHKSFTGKNVNRQEEL